MHFRRRLPRVLGTGLSGMLVDRNPAGSRDASLEEAAEVHERNEGGVGGGKSKDTKKTGKICSAIDAGRDGGGRAAKARRLDISIIEPRGPRQGWPLIFDIYGDVRQRREDWILSLLSHVSHANHVEAGCRFSHSEIGSGSRTWNYLGQWLQPLC